MTSPNHAFFYPITPCQYLFQSPSHNIYLTFILPNPLFVSLPSFWYHPNTLAPTPSCLVNTYSIPSSWHSLHSIIPAVRPFASPFPMRSNKHTSHKHTLNLIICLANTKHLGHYLTPLFIQAELWMFLTLNVQFRASQVFGAHLQTLELLVLQTAPSLAGNDGATRSSP